MSEHLQWKLATDPVFRRAHEQWMASAVVS